MSEWTTTCPDCGEWFTELCADTSALPPPRDANAAPVLIASMPMAVRCEAGHEHAVAEAVRFGDEVRFRLGGVQPFTTMTAALPGANIWRRP